MTQRFALSFAVNSEGNNEPQKINSMSSDLCEQSHHTDLSLDCKERGEDKCVCVCERERERERNGEKGRWKIV